VLHACRGSVLQLVLSKGSHWCLEERADRRSFWGHSISRQWFRAFNTFFVHKVSSPRFRRDNLYIHSYIRPRNDFSLFNLGLYPQHFIYIISPQIFSAFRAFFQCQKTHPRATTERLHITSSSL